MSLAKNVLILAGILTIPIFVSKADIRNISKFTKFICDIRDTVLLTNVSCTTKPIRRDLAYANFRGFVTANIYSAIVHMVMNKKFNLVYRPFLIDIKENYCHLYSKKSSVPYMKIIKKIADPYWNLNHSCPYSGEIIAKDVPMDLSRIPLGWPAGEYRIDGSFQVNNKPDVILYVYLYFEVSERF